MATLQTLINRSLRMLSQLPSGGSPTAAESADAMEAANAMLQSWRNERLMTYSCQDEVVPMVAAQSSYTIGPTATDLVTTRPVRIEDAYIVSGVNTYPEVRIISDEEYDAIPDKTSASTWPTKVNYRPTMPNGTLYVYPVPNATSSLHIRTWIPLTVFAALTDTVSLPPGWEEAIASNLAIAIAPEYEVQPAPSVIKMATDSKANIKRINSQPIRAYTELPQLLGSRRGNIITDQ